MVGERGWVRTAGRAALRAVVALVAVARGAVAQADSAVVRAAVAAELDGLRLREGLPGITCTLLLGDGREITIASGLADVEGGERMTPQHVMPAGSVGKSFVAATVMALVGEGVLDLDAPLSRWLGDRPWYAGLPNAGGLTLRRLLNHSSGIAADYISQPSITEPFVYTIDGYGGKSLAEQGITHDDFAAALSGTPAAFAAGEGYGYSDGNYVLVGLVIERATGGDFYEEVRRRFLQPLGLATIRPAARVVDRLAPGYEADSVRLRFFPPKLADHGRMVLDPGIEWTGGGFTASARDLARWARAFYGGRALAGDYVRALIAAANPHGSPDQGYRYGLGVQVAESAALGTRLQHGGYFPGYSSFMEYVPRFDAALAFQTNTRRGYRVYRAWADALWRAAGVGTWPP